MPPRAPAPGPSPANGRMRGGSSLLSHHPNRSGAVCGCPVTQLAVPVVTPAVDHVAGGDAAREVLPRAHRGEHQTPGDRCRGVLRRRRPIPHLAVVVGSPAIRRVGGRDPAGVIRTCGHRPKDQSAAYGRGERTLGVRAVSDLAVAIVAPAVAGARCRLHAARVVFQRAERPPPPVSPLPMSPHPTLSAPAPPSPAAVVAPAV